MKIKPVPLIALGALLPSLSPAATLTHRWSFNGDLTDSVGAQNAQILDADNDGATGGGSVLGADSVALFGGVNAQSNYVDLGPNLLATNAVTLELWATQNTVKNWSRIFDIGGATVNGGANDNLIMSWTRENNLNSDQVEYRETTLAETGVNSNTNQPYSLGTEFHIAMTLDNTIDGTTTVTWYSADSFGALLGGPKGTFSIATNLASFDDPVAWLGRSHFDGDNTADASYNEFRVYNGVLSQSELQANHLAGANSLVPEPSSLLLGALSLLGLLRRKR